MCFLDIQMPRLNGFDVLGKLSRQPIVIFTTAYDQYALRAFGVNSVDYLLKPIEPEAVNRAIGKVETLRGSGLVVQPDFQILLKQIAESVREESRSIRTGSPLDSETVFRFSTLTP